MYGDKAHHPCFAKKWWKTCLKYRFFKSKLKGWQNHTFESPWMWAGNKRTFLPGSVYKAHLSMNEQTFISSEKKNSTAGEKRPYQINCKSYVTSILFEIISLMMWEVRLNPWIKDDLLFTLLCACTFYYKWQCNYISSRWYKLKLRAHNETAHVGLFFPWFLRCRYIQGRVVVHFYCSAVFWYQCFLLNKAGTLT